MGNSPGPKIRRKGVQRAPKLKNGYEPPARNSETRWRSWIETENCESPGLELKNKMTSLGLKRWLFKMASSSARFGLSTFSSACGQNGTYPGTPNALKA